MQKIVVSVFVLFLFLVDFSVPVFAGGFFQQRETGWFWYKDDEEQKPEKKPKEEKQKVVKVEPQIKSFKKPEQPKEPINREAELLAKLPVHITEKDLEGLTPKQISRLYNLYLERVLYKPNEADLENILIIQDYATKKSKAYALALQEVLRRHPELNPAVAHPPSVYGRKADFLKKESEIKAMLDKWKDDAGLYFFFEDTCKFCQAEVPIINLFQKLYGWQVLGISVSGKCLPQLKECIPDYNNLAGKLGISTYPAIILVIEKNGQPVFIPVSYGLITLDELTEQLYTVLYKLEKGHVPGIDTKVWQVAKQPEIKKPVMPKKFSALSKELNEPDKDYEKRINSVFENSLWGER